jgi:sRNA-binding regulator protein Hfq
MKKSERCYSFILSRTPHKTLIFKITIKYLVFFRSIFGHDSISFAFQVKVMNKQLLLFHNAVSAYFSGNNVALEAAVRHFNIHTPQPATPAPTTTTRPA